MRSRLKTSRVKTDIHDPVTVDRLVRNLDNKLSTVALRKCGERSYGLPGAPKPGALRKVIIKHKTDR